MRPVSQLTLSSDGELVASASSTAGSADARRLTSSYLPDHDQPLG